MSCLDYTAFWILVSIVAYKLWMKLSTGWCKSDVCLVGKTVIITGANSGIGYETAADLAKRGAKVILACRNEKKASEAVRQLIEKTDNPNIEYKLLDLSSFKSVGNFAEDIKKNEKRLDILINNAGVSISREQPTEDGIDLLMQSNYFGHFLLTHLLLDLMKKTKKARIVNISSLIARLPFNFDSTRSHLCPNTGLACLDQLLLYWRSKLCMILFTIELCERLHGTDITTYSVHPGVIDTDIFDTEPWGLRHVTQLIIYLFYKVPKEGAQTSIYCSVAKDIEHLSGSHFQDCHIVDRYMNAWNPDTARELWILSEKLVQLHNK